MGCVWAPGPALTTSIQCGAQGRRNGLAGSHETPEELFAKCEANAKVVNRDIYLRALSILAGILTFPDNLFGQEPAHDSAPSVEGRNSVILQRIIREASRYGDLVHWLKEYPGQQQRWLLLALWLKEEGICEPIEFLPKQVYENLTAEKRAELGVSITDLQHHGRVEAWKPYFERLLKDRRKKKSRDPERDLAQAGYRDDAIAATRNKRLAIPAVCDWLAGTLQIDSGTLRNAHSRISRGQHHKSSDCGL